MRKRPSGSDLQLPLTPMIDCTFQLILFFLLAAQMVGQELPKLALHSPREPLSSALPADAEQLSHVTVNVLTQYDGLLGERDPRQSILARRYQVGLDVVPADRPDAMAALTELLRSRKEQAEARSVSDFWVEIRADKDIRYADIEPVMQAASDAGIARMSLTAKAEENSRTQPAQRR